MKRHIVTLAALTLTLGLIGCGGKNGENGNGKGEGEGGELAAADFSTPTHAVETFIKAGTDKDVETLSMCFAAEAAGEFKNLRDKTATDEDLADFAEFVSGGTVTGEEIAGDAATVAVKFSSRDESISMTKTDEGWKVVDF